MSKVVSEKDVYFIDEKTPHIKDSGSRREFGTGAVRDIQEGKGRCDLMPLDVVGTVLANPTIDYIELFKIGRAHV